MITLLHGSILHGQLVLWGERTPATPFEIRRGRRPKTPAPAPHPFAAHHEELLAGLSLGGVDVRVPADDPPDLLAWLPSLPGLPLPSSPLLGDPPASRARRRIEPWLVSCLPLSGSEAMDLLGAVANRTTLARGVVVGADLAFWSAALRLAATLVARQRFLPGLIHEESLGCAVWDAIPAPEDRTALGALAAAMPSAARALTTEDAAGSPETPAREILDGFVAVLVDGLVRSATTPDAPAPIPVARRLSSRSAGSIHDRWLLALRSDDGVLEGAPAELAGLAEQVRAWRSPLSALLEAPFRLCLRLEEPEAPEEATGGDAWIVRYLVQAADDPSLVVPAELAWSPDGPESQALARSGGDVRAFLLAALGQAATLCPRIEASLRAPAPAGYALDAAGAHDFLISKALLLEQAGFGVMLPSWWSRGSARLRPSARAKVTAPPMQADGGLSLSRVVALDWEIALGDRNLTREELEALARLKAPLVRVRGQWLAMTPEDLAAAIAFWERSESENRPLRDVVHMALGAGSAPAGLPVSGVEADGWIGAMLDRLEGRRALDEERPPAGLAGTLRPYQQRGYCWLGFLRDVGLGACLADDMGLGKTIQALALVLRDRERGERRPALIVCPTSVATNWQREAERFAPDLRALVHHGGDRKRGEEFVREAASQDLVISTYALLHRDLEHLRAVEWAGVLLDEAQNVKNPDAKQSLAARALSADYRIALTGTPVENHVGDLWSLMEFLNPGLLGTRTSFRKRYFLPIQARRDPDAAARLKRLTGPFVLRRLKTDRSIITDLPEKRETKVYCRLTREQVSLYRAVAREAEEALESAEGMKRRGLVLATLTRLKQVCNHPAQLLADGSAVPGRSGKLARLVEMLEEILSVGDRTLIFSQYAEMGRILRGHLQETFGVEVPFLHGGVTKRWRDAMVDRFQSEGGPPIFLLSLKAGGTGLNLTRASHVFHYDRWWNPAVEDQATDRAFRIGQTRDVNVVKLLCAGTMEEAIDELIEKKKDVAGAVVGSGEGMLTELSNDELRTLFALRAEAMGDE